MQRYYVLMGYALTAKPTTLHSEFYVASEVDARIAELECALNRAVELFQDECDIGAEPDSYEWLQTSKSLMER